MNYESHGTLRTAIRLSRPNMRAAEQRVADIVLDNWEECADMTLIQLSQMAGVSETTTIRFCRDLGFQGYTQFRITMAKEQSDSVPREDVELYIDEETSLEEIPQKVFARSIQAFNDSRTAFSQKDYMAALQAIEQAENIYFFAVANSASVADDAMNKLIRIGKKCCAISDIHIQTMVANTLCGSDLAIGISHSGHTKHVINAILLAKRAGAKTMCITGNPQSPLARIVDICLYSAGVEMDFESETMVSRLSQLALIDMIYLGMICSDYDNKTRLLARQNEALDDLSTK